MQKYNFNSGGFVLHDIPGIISGARVSAWYDQDGTLLGSEWFPQGFCDSPRDIPRDWRHVRDRLSGYGRLMRGIDF